MAVKIGPFAFGMVFIFLVAVAGLVCGAIALAQNNDKNQTVDGVLTAKGGVVLGEGSDVLKTYKVYQGTLTMTGAFAEAQTVTFTAERLGNSVLVNFGQVSAEQGSADIVTSTPLPEELWPLEEVSRFKQVSDNGTFVAGVYKISTAGVLTSEDGANGNFSGTGTLILPSQTIGYAVAPLT